MHDGGRAAAVAPLHNLPTRKSRFLTFLPESCARILLEHIKVFVVPSSACTYRAVRYRKARLLRPREFARGYSPDAKTIEDGATAHLDRIGLKFNSIHNRTDDGGFPTRAWR